MKKSAIYNINYSTEYIVDMSSFTGGQIPLYSNLFFRAKLTPTNNMAVQLKLRKSDNPSYSLTFYGSKEYPSDENVINKNRQIFVENEDLHMKYKEKDGEYIIYTFPLKETWEHVNYVVVYFYPYNEINYLSVLISPYEKKNIGFTRILPFNKEFSLNGDSLKKYETNFQFFVKLIKEKNNNLTIEIKLHEDDEPEFFINAYEMDKDSLGPGNSVINSTLLKVPDSIKTVNPNYIQYTFNYSNLNEKTLSFYAQVISSYIFKYFSICVGDGHCTPYQEDSPDHPDSDSGSGSGQGSGVSAGIIVLIVILSFSIIIIALIILKKKVIADIIKFHLIACNLKTIKYNKLYKTIKFLKIKNFFHVILLFKLYRYKYKL